MKTALFCLTCFAWGAAVSLAANSPQPPDRVSDTTWFTHSEECLACHNGLVSPAGEDISIGSDWRASMMANSARDPYWQAGVRREVLDRPELAAAIEHECAACHMPMPRYEAKAGGRRHPVFEHAPADGGDARIDRLSADGVSCTTCHQITSAGFGEKSSFNGGFSVDEGTPAELRRIFGPYVVDNGRRTVMRSASAFVPEEGPALQESEMCATCHTLFTHTLGPGGQVLKDFPEQVPYLEWRHSKYRTTQSCQSCHMPGLTEETPVSSVLGQPRTEVSPHRFRGGNFFMPRMMNRFAPELGMSASSLELEAAALRTTRHLAEDAARVTIVAASLSPAGELEVELEVENRAGHKLPTAYPSRRAWLHVRVTDAAGTAWFESGALQADGSISGNDNDRDPAAFEPHWQTITDGEQVQIYEAVMSDVDGRVTTGLLSAYSYAKDNRLLPSGFDPQTAPDFVAVQGRARDDRDFTGGTDRVTYRVAIGRQTSPLTVTAELWYQPIGFRWADNLRGRGAPETNRFIRYFDAMAPASAARLATGTLVIDPKP